MGAILLESVPNVSEGRRPEVIDRLARALEGGGAHLLDRSSDPDHHRSVFTLCGPPAVLQGALLRLYAAALEAIDLSRHRGAHPRMGAVDVVPFVPLAGAAMSDAAAAARALGRAVAERFELPVYLYGEAASRPERRRLAAIRRGGFEGFAAKIAEPGWEPDFGPRRRHPTAGVTAIGARPFLIAFNAILDTADPEVAREIARRVRESSGGLPAVQALGLYLPSRGAAQVSMNLTDYRRSPPARALDRVREEARRLGARVVATEIVGLVPREALAGSTPEALQLASFRPELVLETHLERLFPEDPG